VISEYPKPNLGHFHGIHGHFLTQKHAHPMVAHTSLDGAQRCTGSLSNFWVRIEGMLKDCSKYLYSSWLLRKNPGESGHQILEESFWKILGRSATECPVKEQVELGLLAGILLGSRFQNCGSQSSQTLKLVR
jgi:hypothetical protein